MRKLLFIALIICSLLLTACSDPTKGLVSVDNSVPKDTTSKTTSDVPKATAPQEPAVKETTPTETATAPKASTNQTAITTQQIDKYTVLQAEISCSLLGVTDYKEIQRIDGLVPSMSVKYGLSSDVIAALKTQFKDDTDFKAKVKQTMFDICPTQANYYMKK